MATAPDGNVVISGRLLGLLVTQERLRRLRVAYAADKRLRSELIVLSSVLLASPERRKVAISPPSGHAGFMTAGEFAAAAGITSRAVQMACRQGRLSAAKRAGIWLIDPAELVRRKAAC